MNRHAEGTSVIISSLALSLFVSDSLTFIWSLAVCSVLRAVAVRPLSSATGFSTRYFETGMFSLLCFSEV
jgi:hypothetical protein